MLSKRTFIAALGPKLKPALRGVVGALSVALIFATVALYARSNARWDLLSATRIDGDDVHSTVRVAQLQSSHGRLCLFTVGETWRVGYPPHERRYWNRGWVFDYWNGDSDDRLPDTPWHGFAYHAGVRKVGPNDRWVRWLWVPDWTLAAIGGIAPTLWLVRRHRRAARIRQGLCGECGYDLRGSQDRCPECGTPFAHELFH